MKALNGEPHGEAEPEKNPGSGCEGGHTVGKSRGIRMKGGGKNRGRTKGGARPEESIHMNCSGFEASIVIRKKRSKMKANSVICQYLLHHSLKGFVDIL